MAELKEIFEMVTNKTEPDIHEWNEQERRQRRRGTSRRAVAFAVAVAMIVALIVAGAALRTRGDSTTPGADTAAPPPAILATSLAAIDVTTGATTDVVGDVSAYGAAVSPDGGRLAFERSVQGKPQIFVQKLSGGHATQLTGLPGQPGCACGAFDPAWSPDGRAIAYSGTDVSGNRGIYTLTLASGEIRLLTPLAGWGGTSFEGTPAWSPDGRRIAFAAGHWDADPAGSGTIYTMAADGSHVRVVAREAGATHPTWSPDSSLIVFAANANGGTELEIVDSEGGIVRPLAAGAAPVFSPDGSTIAFTDAGHVSLFTLGTHAIRTLGQGSDPTWSPEGSTVYAWHAAA
jgi:Tol biopolymer transport system component